MENKNLQDIFYVIRVIEGMPNRDRSYHQKMLDLHENDMKRLLCFYRYLKKENRWLLEEVDQECREQIREYGLCVGLFGNI